jgi:5-methylcytosine-specific restriction endonuclease McrA
VPTRICLGCGGLTAKPSQRGYCPECQRDYESTRPSREVYDSPRWRRLAARVLRAWVRANGWWCPGYGREAHASHDLTADHIDPLAAKGNPWDESNIGVLCRGCNGRKAADLPATRSTR